MVARIPREEGFALPHASLPALLIGEVEKVPRGIGQLREGVLAQFH